MSKSFYILIIFTCSAVEFQNQWRPSSRSGRIRLRTKNFPFMPGMSIYASTKAKTEYTSVHLCLVPLPDTRTSIFCFSLILESNRYLIFNFPYLLPSIDAIAGTMVCVCMVITFSRMGINRVWLLILHVVSWKVKTENRITLHIFATLGPYAFIALSRGLP